MEVPIKYTYVVQIIKNPVNDLILENTIENMPCKVAHPVIIAGYGVGPRRDKGGPTMKIFL